MLPGTLEVGIGIVALLGTATAVRRLSTRPAEDLQEILEAFRDATRNGDDGVTCEEYGPEAYSEAVGSVGDGKAADRPIEIVTAESGS